jgi:hypothetical protein
MSPRGTAVKAEDRHARSRAIDHEFVVTLLTWEEQQRLRRRILRRVRGLARRFGTAEAVQQGRLRERAHARGGA